MAIVVYCDSCRRDTAHSGVKCLICESKRIKESKEAELQTRSKMTVEERLTMLESDMFDLKREVGTIPRNHIYG